MAPVTTPPIEEARSIFANLGYTVSGEGEEFRAQRKWKEVRVTATSDLPETPDSGTLRCFVTWEDDAADVRRTIRRENPEYEWAVISVTQGGDYEVARAPPSAG
jgi:hypothetical protein